MRDDSAAAVPLEPVHSAEEERPYCASMPAGDTFCRVAILFFLYLIPPLCILQPVIVDADIWWQLQAGKWILDHGTVPMTDPFSIFGENKPWIAYSWLFEIAVYTIQRHVGDIGLLLYTLGGAWALVLVLHRLVVKRISDFGLGCALVAACVVSLSNLFTPRPWLLTMIFFAITLEVVLSLRECRYSRWFWGLPFVYVLWANIHIQFIYGLGLLFLACLAPILDALFHRALGRQSYIPWCQFQWRQLAAITLLCSVGTLLTPYHVKLYGVVIELAGQTGMWDYVIEMMAPSFRKWADWAMLAVFAAALFRLGQMSRRSAFEILLLAAGVISAFRGQRDCWLLIMGAIAVFVAVPSNGSRLPRSAVSRAAVITAVVLVIGASIGIVIYRDCYEAVIRKNTARIYPVEAAVFVKQKGFKGPLYNNFNWGGYFIWTLPHLKVSMDGRTNIPGDDRIKRSIETWSGGPKWRDDEDLNQAELVIAQRQFALASLLKLDPRFHLVYEDETASVFIKAHGVDRHSSASSFSAKSLSETPFRSFPD
jgi:hypothetical protein